MQPSESWDGGTYTFQTLFMMLPCFLANAKLPPLPVQSRTFPVQASITGASGYNAPWRRSYCHTKLESHVSR